jgi:hypothetical protein
LEKILEEFGDLRSKRSSKGHTVLYNTELAIVSSREIWFGELSMNKRPSMFGLQILSRIPFLAEKIEGVSKGEQRYLGILRSKREEQWVRKRNKHARFVLQR